MEHKTLSCRWKAVATDSGGLTGYASTFGNVDLGGDVVLPGAFIKSIRRIKAEGIPLLADHIASTDSTLGTIYDAHEDAHGLVISARFASTRRAQDVRQLLVEGHLSKLSIGYESRGDTWEDRDGKRVRLLKEITLWETSVVVFPMNTEATVQSTKQRTDANRLSADAEALLVRLDAEDLRLRLDAEDLLVRLALNN